jgi:GTP:adenosylcobinamide-phosphate guanylyltransferase
MFKESPLFSVAGKKFNVVILAAGMGTRLRPETDHIPKALVELGGHRAIDYAIRKHQYIADKLIIAVGHCGDLLEQYSRGKYGALKLAFSYENPATLRGPGTSLMYALDHADSRHPTLVSFCDYLVEDQFIVDHDCLGICNPGDPESVIDTFKTLAEVRDGIAVDLISNPDLERCKERGFTGIAVFHNTKLLKSIVFTGASGKTGSEDLDYASEIVRPYIRQVKTLACPLSRLLEFGTEEALRRTRRRIDGNRRPCSERVPVSP